ncbi:uncharacterized protein LOC116671453 isoform X2 [Etheostoma spectabile]|uniref:uncharacterized protein LOC116671453 isoform X2 n=1 Tax=Etheostoma spectabile TaxID=54343 RepID=UPI0013AF4C76|nr:uncharacterized protein LOC116671453 isoform X2 [Etheostoma spectabile]XP_032358651.1 uncharacterized protein LOC116671453 isoform X2 [Etheostoma spectabile]
MSGARRMQELKYFRDGATLVISLDGLNWLTERRCSDKGINKRNDELQLLMSSGQMIQADEELQAITCILEQRGSAAPPLWRNSDCRSSLVTTPPALSFSPRHCCVPEEPPRHSTLASLASFVSERPKEAQWTRLILNMQDIFSLIKTDLDIMTEQDIATTDQQNRLIIFCDEDIPLQRFGDYCYTEDCGPSKGDTGWDISDNISTAHGPNTNNSNGNQHELVISDNLNNLKMLQKSCQIYDAPEVLCGRDTNLKKSKSVSFDDDVIVYLFDQESPTVELHSETCTSLPDVTFEGSGLEWEDDFSALEKNCHFQCVRLSQPHPRSLATQTSTALSRRFFLSQTCLFLTHVTESDLEL